MNIRKMLAADKASVIQILANTQAFNALDRCVAEEVIDSYLADPASQECRAFVAEVDNNIAGYICFGHNSMTISTWHIYWITVASAFQGMGIGRELMATAENNIRKLCGKLIVLETSSTPLYDRTNRFYVKLNYTKASRIADFYGPGDDQILYIKRL